MLYNPPTGGASDDPFVGKNVAAGIQGSKVPPGAVEFPQRELINAISATGQSPTNSDLTQLIQAIAIGIDLGTFGGTANALADTIPGSVTISALRTGMTFYGIVSANNTGAVTLNLSGFTAAPGPKPVVRRDGSTALAAGDLAGGTLFAFRYDGSSFRVVGAVPSESSATAINTLLSNAELSEFRTASGGSYSIANGGFSNVVTSDASGTTRLTNNGASGITVNQAGLYAIYAGVTIAISVTTTSYIVGSIKLLKNGAQFALPGVLSSNVGSGNYSFNPGITLFLKLAAGDTLIPSAGAGVTTGFNGASWGSPYFSMQKVA